MDTVKLDEVDLEDDSPRGLQQRWVMELKAAQQEVKGWHDTGCKVIEAYRDDKRDESSRREVRWNLYTANVQTQEAMLYGNTPAVSVDRRFADANDDVARVSAEMLERLLNSDIEKDSDSYAEALGLALSDRLRPGLGVVRVRYDVEFEEDAKDAKSERVLGVESSEPTEDAPKPKRKAYECVETDYVHWQDFLWSPARVWSEVRWVAFRAEMSRKAIVDRFGEEFADVPLTAGRSKEDKRPPQPWDRAEVWEVWDKETKRVHWVCLDYHEVLDTKPDTLGLRRFFPCPKPMRANPTTDTMIPRPDYAIAQDLYRRINLLSTRCALLEDSIRVVGLYDKTNTALQSLLNTASQNQMIPVDSWAMLAEKGGIKGVVDWFPLEQVTAALAQLQQVRQQYIDALYQITGMSDIMRGEATQAGASATEQKAKTMFGSVRMRKLQSEFARFASDVQALKAEVIAKFYDDATIIADSNIENTPDAEFAPAAIELLRSRFSGYRVQVRPEAVSLQDFAALKSESMEVLSGLATFFQAAAPVAQQMPGSLPYLLQMLQWAMSRVQGAKSIEGVLDQAIAAAQQQAAQPPQAQQPDPKVLAQQMKTQGDLAKADREHEHRLAELAAETQAHRVQEEDQMRYNVQEAAQKQLVSNALKPPQQPGRLP